MKLFIPIRETIPAIVPTTNPLIVKIKKNKTMKPFQINLINACVLIIMGLWGYFASADPSPTALIPVGFGAIFGLSTPPFKKGNRGGSTYRGSAYLSVDHCPVHAPSWRPEPSGHAGDH
jgi:hypothetical protein